MLSGFSSWVDTVTTQEILDYGGIDQPEIMFDFMGFGHPPDFPAPLLDRARLAHLWAPVVHLVAEGARLGAGPGRHRDRTLAGHRTV